MSQQDVDLVREVLKAWNRRDLEAFLAVADESIAYVNAPTAVEPGTRHGHDGLRQVLERQWESLGDTARIETEELWDRDPHVVVAQRLSRDMPGSETRLEVLTILRMTVADGRITRVEVLDTGADAGQALADALGDLDRRSGNDRENR